MENCPDRFRVVDPWLRPWSQAHDQRSAGDGDGDVLVMSITRGCSNDGRLATDERLRESVRWSLRPIGFLDDDPELHGRIVQGGRVFGGLDRLEEVSRARRAEALLVTIQQLEDERWQELRERCQKAGLKLRHLRLSIVEIEEREPEEREPKDNGEASG